MMRRRPFEGHFEKVNGGQFDDKERNERQSVGHEDMHEAIEELNRKNARWVISDRIRTMLASV